MSSDTTFSQTHPAAKLLPIRRIDREEREA